ncbi:uncharacterized protein LOC143909173 [Arctopsyche grandis]|uniref:uncharacterized protein LOC143909173 n=1 Tax=Arctopsyche grandis TaxID=121162 RepID=UPI00406D7D2B
MKQFICIVAILAVVAAEPPYYRVKGLQRRSQEINIPTVDVEPIIPKEADSPRNAPYPPSGWRPMGQRFELPPPEEPTTTVAPEEEETPMPEYGPPQVVYGPPQNVYGPPKDEVEATTPTTEKDVEETTDSSEDVESRGDNAQNAVNQQGLYYILLPDSRLQKYYYNMQSDPRLQQYSSVYSSTGYQQLSSPLYIYNPQFYYPWM